MTNRANKTLGDSIFPFDIFFTILTFLSSYWVRDVLMVHEEPLNLYSHIFLFPLLLLFLISLLSYFGGYAEPRETSLTRYSWAIIRTIAVSVGLLLSLLFFLKITYISRSMILIFAGAEFVVLLTIRAFAIAYFNSQMKSGMKKLRILIIGTKARAQELVKALQQESGWGVEIVGFIDPDPAFLGQKINGIPVIGTVANTDECLKNNIVDEVIIAISRSLLEDAEPIVIACEEEGIPLRFMADVFNVQVARVSLSQISGIPLLNMEPVAQDEQQLFAKRLFDLILTIFAIPFLIPLFLLVAIAIKLDSPGPVFFRQPRVGLKKHIFQMYKFRSMFIDAEERFKEIEHLNEAEGPIFKMENDPRATRVGRFIRKTSIDELPQLINVIKGEMSVQPGLTCLWQISGRSNLPFEKWLEFDLEYIEHWTFWFDVKILIKTIPAVLFSKGAV